MNWHWIITSTPAAAKTWVERFEKNGDTTELLPLITTRLLPLHAPTLAPRYDWLLITSLNALAALRAADLLGKDLACQTACVGASCAQALQALGHPCHWIAPDSKAHSLQKHLLNTPPSTVLLPQGSLNDGKLARALRSAGFLVENPPAYLTCPRQWKKTTIEKLQKRPCGQGLVFTSGSAVQSFIDQQLPSLLPSLPHLSLGPSATLALRENKLKVTATIRRAHWRADLQQLPCLLPA